MDAPDLMAHFMSILENPSERVRRRSYVLMESAPIITPPPGRNFYLSNEEQAMLAGALRKWLDTNPAADFFYEDIVTNAGLYEPPRPHQFEELYQRFIGG